MVAINFYAIFRYGIFSQIKGNVLSLILENFQEMTAFFGTTLQAISAGGGKQRPLLIVLDSLDQLEGLHGAHKCKWLPKRYLPNVHIVLSTLPGMHKILDNLKLLFAADGYFLEVNPLPETTGVEIFGTWMREIHRRITADQAEIVRKGMKRQWNSLLNSKI